MALIKQALFVDLLQRPPFRLDVIIFIGNIRVVHVRPKAYPVAHMLPFGLVFPNGFLALLDERLHAILLDLLLPVKAKKLFNFKLHRQTMGVPAGFAQHIVYPSWCGSGG